MAIEETQPPARTAGEIGWHLSRYNLSAPVPGTDNVAIANLFKGTCAEYSPMELYMLSVIEELDEHYPMIERFARRGVICNFEERAALESLGRMACAMPHEVTLTICPTMGCNFDCPYCFEDHKAGKMGADVQGDVVALAERMLDVTGSRDIAVTWFGGEPLLAPDVIESLSGRLMKLVEGRGGAYRADIVTNGYLLTQDVVDMLDRCKVSKAQITVDGLGPSHDATRHLAGGGPTFERITSNLRELKIPFTVNVRNNVHQGNIGEADGVRALVESLAEASGNTLLYYAAPITGSETAGKRGGQVRLLCGGDAGEMVLDKSAESFQPGLGHVCGAHSLWSIGIDERGNLQTCWEAVDKPQLSFGTAHDWNPADPLATANNPDNLTMFLNTSGPVPDEECRSCAWLPQCAGGCPYQRLFEKRRCTPFRDDPEAFVLALHERIGKEKKRDGSPAGPV